MRAISAKVMHVPGAAIDFGYIGNIVILLLVLYVISAACSYIQGWLMTGVAMKGHLQIQERHIREDRPSAAEIFRYAHLRRGAFARYQ